MRHRRQRVDDRFPYRVVGGDVRHRPPAGARLERASRGQPFDAIGMIAADAGDRVAGAARHADMAELAMPDPARGRSEEHTSELQSLMRISYAVFCLKKKRTYEQYRTYKQTIRHT